MIRRVLSIALLLLGIAELLWAGFASIVGITSTLFENGGYLLAIGGWIISPIAGLTPLWVWWKMGDPFLIYATYIAPMIGWAIIGLSGAVWGKPTEPGL